MSATTRCPKCKREAVVTDGKTWCPDCGEAALNRQVVSRKRNNLGKTRHRGCVDRGELEWEPYPVKALPKSVERYVMSASRAMGVDPSMVGVPMVAMLASCIGTTRSVRIKRAWSEPCTIWSAVIAESGTKKTPAMQAVLAPLRRIQRRRFDQHAEAMQRHKQEIAEYERRGNRSNASTAKELDLPTKPEPPVCRRHLTSDTTTEAVVTVLQQNPRGVLLTRDELAGWFGDMDRYSNGKGGDAPRWLSMWSADPITVDRKSTGTTYVHRPAVSITGSIQPGILRRTLGTEHREDGMAARFLMAMPPEVPDTWSDDDISPERQADLERIVETLLALTHDTDDDGHPCPVEVGVDPDARARFIEWHDKHIQRMTGHTGELRAALAKMKGYVLRLALVFHMTRQASGESVRDDIDEQSVNSAINLVEWHIREAYRLYGMLNESAQEAELRQLAELVGRLADPVRGITANDLRRRSRSFTSAHEAERAIDQLVGAGYGDWRVEPTRGRPRTAFHFRSGVYVSTKAKNA